MTISFEELLGDPPNVPRRVIANVVPDTILVAAPNATRTDLGTAHVGYHGTNDLEAVLREGLRRTQATSLGCRTGHICIAETPHIAGMFGEHVLVVDLTGLPEASAFFGAEARVHAHIPPSRISVFEGEVLPSIEGHVDPFHGYPERQHPACVSLHSAMDEAGFVYPS